MSRLLAVNVGLPRDIEWNGHVVHTGIWKKPVAGRCQVRRHNLAGDGQGDLAGHGGEQRAVFVYQIESYRYWEQRLGRTDFEHGQFGENFTVEGLPDDEVCIGDRYRIGTALFEVTQPRVTCYRIGIRMNEPRMPALLTSSGRPGFYLRVLQEGEVGAGDAIVKAGEAREKMTVAEINALLYLPGHAPELLRRALRIEALSPGWRGSFEAMLEARVPGNAGLILDSAAHPVAPGFRRLVVTAIDRETADVISMTLHDPEDQPLPLPMPGQFVVAHLQRPGAAPLVRSYSLSGPPSTQRYRVSVKIEPGGAAGTLIQECVRVRHVLDVSAPRGSFILLPGERPVALISAGIGATPVLAMLHALSASNFRRPVWWLHAARDSEHHPFGTEVCGLLRNLADSRRYVCYSRPGERDKVGIGFDAVGHLTEAVLLALGLPRHADVYLCGPNRFMTDMKLALSTLGVAPDRIHVELFNGGESMMPGVVGAQAPAPHPPPGDANLGPRVSFARSGVAAHWKPTYRNLLELAEACDVPVRWSCRAGVCHSCESGLVSGAVAYDPAPLDSPAEGNVLICCSRPNEEVVLDL